MSDLVINVKQISNYPPRTQSDGTENILVQVGGLGGPYQSITSEALVRTALGGSSIGIGTGVPAGAVPGQMFANSTNLPLGDSVLWNVYDQNGIATYWNNGIGVSLGVSATGLGLSVTPNGSAGGAVSGWTSLLLLNIAGTMALPYGTLQVARDPAATNEVATLGWVGNNTVASFNGRIGQVQLTSSDVYQALGYVDYLATQPWVIGAINAAIGNLLTTYPIVTTWNGRTGDILLTLSDITCTFFQPGQQPISPTPPATSNDNSIATTQWVTQYITQEISGSGGTLATQTWVLANTVNSFNGRVGPVQLTGTDVFDVGAAPTNSPNFSGIPTTPTAATGTSTGQVASTAFVMNAVAASTSGVSSFNTRTGAVTLTNADITGAGGISNPSAALTGTPTAPTASPGTNTTQLATTQFVTAAITAGAVTSFNTRTGAVSLQLTDITGVGGAPIASPTLTGIPAAPTASPGTATTQLATTQFVTAAITAAGGVSSFNSRTGAVTLQGNDISAAGGLVNPSVNLTGVPTVPTANPGTNTQQIANTAFVQNALNTGTVTSFNTRAGAVTLVAADITGAGGALLASPALTGAPTAPTAAPGTSNTQLATTAFVSAAIAANTNTVTSFNTRTGAVTLTLADVTGVGGAPLASPAFSGTPTAATATPGTSTTQIATTAFVANAIATSGVNSFNSRTGAVTLISNDISAAGGALLAGPAFTGTPTAPTAAPGTNTTQLATTAFVQAGFLPLAGGTVTGNVLTTAPAVHAAGATPPGNMNGGMESTQYVLPLNGNGVLFNRYQTSSASMNVSTGYAGYIFLDQTNGFLHLGTNASAAAGAAVGAGHEVYVDQNGGLVGSITSMHNMELWGPAGTARAIYSDNGTQLPASLSRRWGIVMGDGTAETGSDAGNNFVIQSYHDTGAYIGQVMLIRRSDGLVTLPGSLQVNSQINSNGNIWCGGTGVFAAQIILNLSPGNQLLVQGQINGVQRWLTMHGDGTPEGGGNSGSNYTIQAHDDGGSYLGNPLQINRQSLVATFQVPINNGSDIRMKRDIEPVTNALAIVNLMQGVFFRHKGQEKRYVGLIAQDVRGPLPEVVFENPAMKEQAAQYGVEEGEPLLGISYANIVAVLIEAIKELTARVAGLEERLAA